MVLSKDKKRETAKLAIAMLIILAICAVCEIFVFNFRYFLPVLNHAKNEVFTADDVSDEFGCDLSDGKIIVESEYVGFLLGNVDTPVYNIKINVEGCSGTFDTQIKYEDDNFTSTFLSAGTWTVDPYVEGTQYFSVTSSGSCSKINFYLTNIADEDFTITSIEINHPYFNFNPLRFSLLFLFLAAIYLIRHFKLWKIPYNPFSKFQSVLYSIVVLVCLSITVFTFCVSVDDVAFRKELKDPTNDSFQLLTKAFYNKQLYLPVEASEDLKSLSNPYDFSVRNTYGISYLFDVTYYNGKYYSYFGVAPVVTLLLPFKILTGLYMPTSIACFIFILIAIFAMLSLYRQVVDLWFRDINLLIYIFGEIAIVLCSNILWLISVPVFYELAFISTTAFFFLALDMIFYAYKGRKHTGISLFLSGLFFALMVASRPNNIFYIFLAGPFLFAVIKGCKGIRKKMRPLAQFFGPLVVSGILIMIYNYLRFGSVLEFGAQYQLTLSDVRYNKLTNVSLIFNGLFHYFLQPISVTMEFPFFTLQKIVTTQITHYYFNIATAGIISYPLMVVLFASVYIIKRMPGKSVKKYFVSLAMAVSLIVIYIDITVAGVTMRYSLDITPILTLCAVILWMEIYRYFNTRNCGAPLTKFFVVVVFVTTVMAVNICVMGEDKRLMYYFPDIYYYLYDTFTFWN